MIAHASSHVALQGFGAQETKSKGEEGRRELTVKLLLSSSTGLTPILPGLQ